MAENSSGELKGISEHTVKLKGNMMQNQSNFCCKYLLR